MHSLESLKIGDGIRRRKEKKDEVREKGESCEEGEELYREFDSTKDIHLTLIRLLLTS